MVPPEGGGGAGNTNSGILDLWVNGRREWETRFLDPEVDEDGLGVPGPRCRSVPHWCSLSMSFFVSAELSAGSVGEEAGLS